MSFENMIKMKYLRLSLIVSAFLLLSGFTECYKPVTNSGLPKNIKTVAVPAFQFEAKGLRYRVESRFTDAVTREIIRRGNGLKVQGSLTGADAVLEGTIRDFSFSGVLLDSEGRARVYEVTIVTAVTIRDLKENKVLYDNQNFTFRDSFEFSSDPRSFFNEEDPAVERMARAFAESAVSAFINGIGVKEEKK
ncbi:MAG: LptE family protein [Chloracidobacterium sp.]|nr:LptE family protein [Chloracidobacterium sp.]